MERVKKLETHVLGLKKGDTFADKDILSAYD